MSHSIRLLGCGGGQINGESEREGLGWDLDGSV